MAETQEQWYDILQETYDKWSREVDTIKQEIDTIKQEIDTIKQQGPDEETDNEENDNVIRNLDKKINNILPTLEKYKYYLDYRANPTKAIVESED